MKCYICNGEINILKSQIPQGDRVYKCRFCNQDVCERHRVFSTVIKPNGVKCYPCINKEYGKEIYCSVS